MGNVLVACEYSGTVREAFRAAGHNAFSCDLLPADDGSPNHYQGDARDVILKPAILLGPGQKWDLMIAHPPCTYLANSGVRWLHSQPGRWREMEEGAAMLRWMLEETGIPRVCVENPVIHKYAAERIGSRQDQFVQPWQFGHGESKRTGFWLRNLPPLVPTNVVEGREQRIWKLPPSPDRWKIRSKTYDGIAAAMAEQWGKELP